MGYAYDGDRLRVRKDENGQTTYYVRSSVLGGQVVAEINSAGVWLRGHVYLGSQALAVQENNTVSWVHEDPVTKTKKRTDASGTVTSSTLVDPWGGEVTGAWVQNAPQQKRKFTTYERGADDRDEAQHRGYSARASRFDQPDPYDGSYGLTNPQSLNRYAYTQNDPVNFVDPSGLNLSSGGAGAGCWFNWTATGWYQGEKLIDVTNFRGSVVCYGSNGGGGGLGGGPSPIGDRTPDACGDMAAIAEYHARNAIEEAKGDMTKALQLFDEGFSKEYLGYPLKTVGDGWKLGRKGGLNSSTIESFHRGSTGFQESLKDGYPFSTNGKDQTHHFAAYLSAAINGVTFSSIAHQLGDMVQANAGDTRLGGVGMDIGRDLKKDPNKLKSIRDMILKSVCDPR